MHHQYEHDSLQKRKCNQQVLCKGSHFPLPNKYINLSKFGSYIYIFFQSHLFAFETEPSLSSCAKEESSAIIHGVGTISATQTSHQSLSLFWKSPFPLESLPLMWEQNVLPDFPRFCRWLEEALPFLVEMYAPSSLTGCLVDTPSGPAEVSKAIPDVSFKVQS